MNVPYNLFILRGRYCSNFKWYDYEHPSSHRMCEPDDEIDEMVEEQLMQWLLNEMGCCKWIRLNCSKIRTTRQNNTLLGPKRMNVVHFKIELAFIRPAIHAAYLFGRVGNWLRLVIVV